MVTSSAPSHHAAGDVSYSSYLREANAQEAQAANYGWMEPIVIEDDDLMFGGKSLSTWYEEERRSLHAPAEEERRGRQRVSFYYNSCFVFILHRAGYTEAQGLTRICRYASSTRTPIITTITTTIITANPQSRARAAASRSTESRTMRDHHDDDRRH
jgi:hypothetical protein